MTTVRIVVATASIIGSLTINLATTAVGQETDPETLDNRIYALSIEPFTNVTATQSDAWIGEGIAEALAVALGIMPNATQETGQWLVRGAYIIVGLCYTRRRFTEPAGSGTSLFLKFINKRILIILYMSFCII